MYKHIRKHTQWGTIYTYIHVRTHIQACKHKRGKTREKDAPFTHTHKYARGTTTHTHTHTHARGTIIHLNTHMLEGTHRAQCLVPVPLVSCEHGHTHLRCHIPQSQALVLGDGQEQTGINRVETEVVDGVAVAQQHLHQAARNSSHTQTHM